MNSSTMLKNPVHLSPTVLGTFELFSCVDSTQRAAIAKTLRLTHYEAGQHIVTANQKDTSVYFIVSGRVRACAYSENGKQIQFEDLTAGMMFGELSAIDKQQRSSDCITVEPSAITKMSADQFMKIIHDHPSVTEKLLIRLTMLVRRNLLKVTEFSSYTVAQRVRFELIRIASEAATGESPIVIVNPPTHADIAARINTHREAVTREIKKLEKQGIITWIPGNHVIHDMVSLTSGISD